MPDTHQAKTNKGQKQDVEIVQLRSTLEETRAWLQWSEARIEELEGERSALHSELEQERAKLERLRSRKWSRLGSLLEQIQRQPWRMLRAPLDVYRIVFGRSALSPHPRTMDTSGRLAVDTIPPVEVFETPRRDVSVATLFLQEEQRRFEPEWRASPVSPEGWRAILSDHRPELLFVASTAVGHSWPGELASMVRTFSEAGVPTAFWHNSGWQAVDDHLKAARLFDVVFCQSESSVEAYRSALPDAHIEVLEPSIQTRLYNPVLSKWRSRDLVHIEPAQAPMQAGGVVVEPARSMGAETVRRNGDSEDGLAPEQIPNVLKMFRVAVVPPVDGEGLVTPSELLEIAATNTPIVADTSLREDSVLGPCVLRAGTPEAAMYAMRSLLRSSSLRSRLSHQALRTVMRSHTTSHRVDQILAATGLREPQPPSRVTAMVPTNRPSQLDNILSNLGRQTYPSLSALLVLHGVKLDHGDVEEAAQRHGVDDIRILEVDESVVLGEVFNIGFSETETEFVAKMDDDDYYGPEYAADLMDAFTYTEADVVGKWAHYAYVEDINSTVLRNPRGEHSYQPILAISTLVMRRRVTEEHKFPPLPRGSGSKFLRAAGADGVRVYSADRYNYMYMRQSEGGHNHTWSYADFELTAKANVVCRGKNIDEVIA